METVKSIAKNMIWFFVRKIYACTTKKSDCWRKYRAHKCYWLISPFFSTCIDNSALCKLDLVTIRAIIRRPWNISVTSDVELELAELIQCRFLQVNNYDIVVKIFHISHDLTRYSAIVHKFTRIHPICSTYELTKQFI